MWTKSDVDLIVEIIRKKMHPDYSGPNYASKIVLDSNGLFDVERELKEKANKKCS